MRFAHWFPLIPRPRPPADSLQVRVERLTAAGRTARFGSGEEALAAAAQVYNGAALLASDVGLPELARKWCWEHARKYLAHLPLDSTGAQRALEPVVNLARLRIRAGEGTEALAMLTALREGVRTATPTVIDGYELPLDRFTASEEDRVALHRWVWTVCLGDGLRALAAEGRWREAAEQARRHGGIGERLFDGRQVAVIAALTEGNPKTALTMAEGSEVREPWEKAVQAVLSRWCRVESGGSGVGGAAAVLQRVHDAQTPQVVFQTRLGITATELVGGPHGDTTSVVSRLVNAAVHAQDGYAARDLLNAWKQELSQDQVDALGSVLNASGIDTRTLPQASLHALRAMLKGANRRLRDGCIPARQEAPQP